MKKHLLIFAIFSFLHGNSQISVGDGETGKLSKKQYEKFKSTTTIFVLPELYEKEVYENILSKSWDVTPFKIVDESAFELKEYLGQNNSFASVHIKKYDQKINPKSTQVQSAMVITNFEFAMYDDKNLLKELESKKNKNTDKLINKFKTKYGRFRLYGNDKIINELYVTDRKKVQQLYNENYSADVFFNYTPGLLKNYFQKINELLKNNEKHYISEKEEYIPELKELSAKALYIVPSYEKTNYDPIPDEKKEGLKLELDNMLFTYKFITNAELNDKILNEESFYYLRYARSTARKYYEVVNSKTGEIVYRSFSYGPGLNIKDFKTINKALKKVLK